MTPESTAMKLPNSKYMTADISDELSREVFFTKTGETYFINRPKTLIIRKGGSTHRVVDQDGLVHCYAAPETGLTVLRWTPKNVENPVQF